MRAFAHFDAERARRRADELEREGPAAPLRGVPVGVKDIVDTAGIPTEFGSALFRGRVPERSATLVTRLERAGAVVIGKTVTAELAFYHPGPTRNPWDLTRTPGGSSMGSAAGVAAGFFPLAVGSQTNGSTIRPAAFCGVVGFKPTHGRLPVDGVMPFAPTLDTVGGFARTVEEVARLCDVLAGEEPRAVARLERPTLAVAWTTDFADAQDLARARFDADVAALASAGARMERPELPAGIDEAIPVLRTIMAVEGAMNLAPLVAGREDGISAVLRDLIDEGARRPVSEYEAALRERERLRAEWAQWARGYDAVLTLPALGEAPSAETTGDPRFCTRWTLLGAPAATIPTGLGPGGLPLGLQLVGVARGDERVLAAAAWAQASLAGPGEPRLA